MAVTVSSQIAVQVVDDTFTRADIQFDGVDHSGPSFEARIFLNNPSADESTERVAETGYAGSFYIFGHGGCFGDVGHCDVRPRRRYDPRPSHPLTEARKTVIATDAVRRARAKGEQLTVTAVPVVTSGAAAAKGEENVLKFSTVRIITYR
jgi:hypothetical protein